MSKTKDKTTKVKKQKSPSGAGFYYSFLTIVLILCFVQITCGAFLNISKLVSYQSKMAQLQENKKIAEARNKQLKEDISSFSAVASLEAIARNNLKMASDDEVLVIINSKPKEEEEALATVGKPFKLDFMGGFRKND